MKHRALIVTPASRAFATALLLLVFFALPAHAGFKFVAPDGEAGMSSAAPTSPVVEGFGDRVPLPVALRQILPRGTIYNIASDVDMGVQVSWKGGRPWQQVLNDSLSQVGLQASITSSAVTVSRAAYLNGNVSGTSEPIQLMPPVRLTPLLNPVIIGDSAPALTPPQSSSSSNGLRTIGEVTSDNPDAPVGAPVTPVVADNSLMPQARPTSNVQTFEVTSNDADIRAEASGVKMGSPAGFLTLPAGSEGAAVTGGEVVYDNGSTLAPLDGSAPPVVIGEAQMANPNLWEARAGQTLREVVTTWAERGNVEVNWQSEYDYPVQASLSYTGTFEEAIRTLLFGFKDATPQPIGRLHMNNSVGQQALLITTRGNIYEE